MKKFRKSSGWTERGFTLIELLVVVAILGVLAAVVVPHVAKFMNQKEEAMMTELHNVRVAVHAMQAKAKTTALDTGCDQSNDVSAVKITVDDTDYMLGDYLTSTDTAYYYTISVTDGAVTQFETGS